MGSEVKLSEIGHLTEDEGFTTVRGFTKGKGLTKIGPSALLF